MSKIVFFLIAFIGLSFSLKADSDITFSKKLLMDISRTYGYYLGQSYTLNNIKKKYPSLKNYVHQAQNEFKLVYGSSVENMDSYMSSLSQGTWKELKKKFSLEISTHINVNISRNDALGFIEEVKLRAKGNIETPVLETLLMFNPKYMKDPEKEFYEGFQKKYISDNLKKSKGLDFTIDVPMSWVSKEANRPNIVRKFISQNGHAFEMAMVLILDFPGGIFLSSSDVKSVVNKEGMTEALPPDAILKDYGYTTLETLPGYWQRFSMKAHRLKMTLYMELLTYSFFYKDKLIQIQFQVGDIKKHDLEKRFQKFEPLFEAIANSFVLTSMYKEL